MTDIQDATRLAYLAHADSQVTGSHALMRKNRDKYRQLIQRYLADEAFETAVDQALDSMELVVLQVSEQGMQLASKDTDSLWATKAADYKLRLGKTDIPSAPLLIVHLAIAMVLFPDPADLDAPPEDIGVLTVSDTLEMLKRFSAGNAALSEEDDLLQVIERQALADFAELPEIRPDASDKNADSWLGLTNRVIDHLVETRFLLRFENDDDIEAEYRVPQAYQVSFRHAGGWLFTRFRELLMSAETDTDGNLTED